MSDDDDVVYVPHTCNEFKVQRKDFYAASESVAENTALLNKLNETRNSFTTTVYLDLASDNVRSLMKSVKRFRETKTTYHMTYEYLLERLKSAEAVEFETKVRGRPELLPVGDAEEHYNRFICPATMAVLLHLLMVEGHTRWTHRKNAIDIGEDPDFDVDEESLRVSIDPVLGLGAAKLLTASMIALEKLEDAINKLVAMDLSEGNEIRRQDSTMFLTELKLRDRKVQLHRLLVDMSFLFLQKEENRIMGIIGNENFNEIALKSEHGAAVQEMVVKLDELDQKHQDSRYPIPTTVDTLYKLPQPENQQESENLIQFFERLGRRLRANGLFEENDLELIVKYPSHFMDGIMRIDF